MSDRDADWAALHNPATSADEVTRIAREHPEFATAVAAHPNASADIRAWAAAAAAPQPAVPPVPNSPVPLVVAAPPTNGFAIASLILSIAGIFTYALSSILGVIFGHIALSQIKRRGGPGKGLAIAGLITGYIVIGVGIIALIGFIVFVVWIGHLNTSYYYYNS